MADAETAILEMIRQVIAGQVTLAPDQVVWAGREELARQSNTVRRQLAQLQERFQRQLVAYEQGILDLNELRAAKQRLATEQGDLESTLQDIQRRLADDHGPDRALAQAFQNIMRPWRDDDPVERRRGLLSQVLDHFVYNRRTDELRIVFRLPSNL